MKRDMTEPATKAISPQVEARVTGNALVVSFTGGNMPKVWRADMAQISTSALELKESAGKIALVMKTPHSEEEVFLFSDREEAVAGLKVITHALFAQEQAVPRVSGQGHAAPKRGVFAKVMKVALYVFLAFVAFNILSFFLMSRATNTVKEIATTPPPVKTGVPMPAEDMFSK